MTFHVTTVADLPLVGGGGEMPSSTRGAARLDAGRGTADARGLVKGQPMSN